MSIRRNYNFRAIALFAALFLLLLAVCVAKMGPNKWMTAGRVASCTVALFSLVTAISRGQFGSKSPQDSMVLVKPARAHPVLLVSTFAFVLFLEVAFRHTRYPAHLSDQLSVAILRIGTGAALLYVSHQSVTVAYGWLKISSIFYTHSIDLNAIYAIGTDPKGERRGELPTLLVCCKTACTRVENLLVASDPSGACVENCLMQLRCSQASSRETFHVSWFAYGGLERVIEHVRDQRLRGARREGVYRGRPEAGDP